MVAASSASTTRDENSRSAAWPVPTRRGSTHDSPYSAGYPRRGADVVSFAPAAAKRMSQKHASTRPTPAAGPLTAAMMGFGMPKLNAKAWSNSGRTPWPGVASGSGSPAG